MDKVSMIGGYGFVDFNLCKNLLENGYEVNVFLFDRIIGENIEEKRMQIGRNANFNEYLLNEWEGKTAEDAYSTIILSLYDLFMEYKENILLKNDRNKQKLLQQISKCNRIVLLVPIQVLLVDMKYKKMKEFIGLLEGLHAGIQIFYLPTIYGPWQPATFLFQKSLLSDGGVSEDGIPQREWRNDAIFIEDVLEPILITVETGVEGHYLLESGISDRWNECADFLKINKINREIIEENELTIGSYIHRIQVNSITPIAESFEKQKDHIAKLSDE